MFVVRFANLSLPRYLTNPWVIAWLPALKGALEPRLLTKILLFWATLIHLPRKIITQIVSITKFWIVIGFPHAYLSRNRSANTWVSNFRCRVWTFCNRTPVVLYPRYFHAYYARFNCFLSNVFYNFQKLGKSAIDVFAQKKFSEDIFFFPKFVIDTVN